MVKEVMANGGVGNREIHLTLKEKAYALGLSEATVLKQIRQGFFGEEVQRLIIGRDEVKIWIRYPDEDRNSTEDLKKKPIKTLSGNLIPLEEIADIDEDKRGRVKINHINGTKEIRVDATLYNSEFSSEVNNQIEIYP